ncbi:nuclear pore complex subunit [Paraconiothyrium brasiliense]|uniref:Nuclear pore complex subunit n=1 Tax=Paraconiothyrium brasiliense TaxID=300254 RepID=A0ABR3RZK5_9PLEO
MSLFGSLGGNQPASSAPKSLFGNPPSASTASTPSLFQGLGASTSTPAGTSTTTAPGASGLFSGLGGGASSAAPAPSLFSSLGGASSQPQSTGLFASKPADQAQQPASTNPFASNRFANTGNAASAPGTQPSASTSAFGSNRFGSTANAQQTGSLGGSTLFGASSAQPQEQQQQASGPLSQPSAGTSAHFDHLLERSRKRNAGENGFGGFGELPALQLGLGDIARKVRNLGQGGPSATQAQDRTAHYLLSASGVKLGSTLRDLNQFSTQAGVGATAPTSNLMDADVDSYIANLHSQSTLALIQEGLEQSKRDFDAFLEDNVQIEWDKQRQRIYEHFGLGRQSEELAASQATFAGGVTRGAFGRSTRKGRSMGTKSVNGTSFAASTGPPVIGSIMSPSQKNTTKGDSADKSILLAGQTGFGDRHTREKQERFMGAVKRLNVSRQTEQTFPILDEFEKIEQDAEGENSDHFVQAYRALSSIVTTDPLKPETPFTPKERCFRVEYLNDQANASASVQNRKRVLNGSRTYLEKKFLEHVQDVLKRNAADARPGGEPTMVSKIRGFVRAKIAQKELGTEIEHLQKIGGDNDDYPWVILFYLLRGGLVTDAAAYVRERRNFFQNTDRNFQAAVDQYAQSPDRRLEPDMQQKITHVHSQRQRIAPSNDPYRMACYKIIGRCELTRKSLDSINQGMEDWVWLQFNLARESNRAEESAMEAYGLEEIRQTVTDIGKRHFMNDDSEAAGGHGVYFWLAILAGMFESAVSFLYQHNYITAVHFAIALDYYGLLRVSNFNDAGVEILTYTQQQRPQFNFAWVVGRYTADFRAARADAAAEYLILICLNADLPNGAGKQQADVCHEALRELVLETREFATLLGDVRSNGHATDGLIKDRIKLIKLTDDEALVNSITSLAARKADEAGRTNDAVLLNHLAEQYENVVSILCRALSEALSVEIGQTPLRLEPLKPRLPALEQQQVQDTGSSLSLLGTDDPVELTHRVSEMYDRDQLWHRHISQSSRQTLEILFMLNRAKSVIEAQQYTQALDSPKIIQSLRILPLDSKGSLSDIRASANNFSAFAPEIARNIGNVLLWSIGCCSKYREVLLKGAYEDPTRQALAAELAQKAKDLMVFAGLIRYKLPPRVFERLAREGGDGY